MHTHFISGFNWRKIERTPSNVVTSSNATLLHKLVFLSVFRRLHIPFIFRFIRDRSSKRENIVKKNMKIQ